MRIERLLKAWTWTLESLNDGGIKVLTQAPVIIIIIIIIMINNFEPTLSGADPVSFLATRISVMQHGCARGDRSQIQQIHLLVSWETSADRYHK